MGVLLFSARYDKKLSTAQNNRETQIRSFVSRLSGTELEPFSSPDCTRCDHKAENGAEKIKK